jgi:hypothetical protein
MTSSYLKKERRKLCLYHKQHIKQGGQYSGLKKQPAENLGIGVTAFVDFPYRS